MCSKLSIPWKIPFAGFELVAKLKIRFQCSDLVFYNGALLSKKFLCGAPALRSMRDLNVPFSFSLIRSSFRFWLPAAMLLMLVVVASLSRIGPTVCKSWFPPRVAKFEAATLMVAHSFAILVEFFPER